MTLQATVHLKRVTVAPVTDLSQQVVSGSAGSIGGGGSRNDNFTMTGSFRTYANGVTRLLTGTSNSRAQTLVLRALTPDQVTLLYSMVGKTCLFRDSYGRHLYGAFLVTDATDLPLSGEPGDNTLLTDIALVIQSVTYTEGA